MRAWQARRLTLHNERPALVAAVYQRMNELHRSLTHGTADKAQLLSRASDARPHTPMLRGCGADVLGGTAAAPSDPQSLAYHPINQSPGVGQHLQDESDETLRAVALSGRTATNLSATALGSALDKICGSDTNHSERLASHRAQVCRYAPKKQRVHRGGKCSRMNTRKMQSISSSPHIDSAISQMCPTMRMAR